MWEIETEMKLRTIQGILLGVVIGIAVGIGVHTLKRCQGLVLPHGPSGGLRQLPRHARTIRRLAQSSHRAVATCKSCHTPANFIGKYATKASNGFWHSFFFTTGGYEDNIQIKPHSREITEQACRTCQRKSSARLNSAPGSERRASSLACAATTRWVTCTDATHHGVAI